MENREPKDNEKTNGIFAKITGNDRLLGLIVIIGLLGIAFIFISSYIRPPETESQKSKEESSMLTSSELEEYRSTLSEELGNMLASMEGVGRTKVMITVEGSARNIYATDVDVNGRETSRKNGDDENADKQNTEKKSCIVIRQKDGSEKALTIGQLMPKIQGVLIICDGGDDSRVRSNVIAAVSTALDISETHICVSKLS